MSAPAGPSGLCSSGLQDSTQLQRGQTAKLAAHSHVASLGRRSLTPGVIPIRGGGHMCLRGVTTRAVAAGSRPGLTKPAWSISRTAAMPDTELDIGKPRASVIAGAYRRRSSRSRATKNDNNSSSSSSGSGKGFGGSSSSTKKGSNNRRSKGRSTSNSEPEHGAADDKMQQQDTAHQDEIPYSSSREEAAAAAAEPTPSDLLQTAGHVEVPPGPAALSTAEHAVEAAAAAAKASDTATVTGGSSAGSASSSRDIDSPGPDSDVPDSPPWSPDGPDNTPPDPPDQPISGAMGRDRSDEPTTAGDTPTELDNLQHLQPGHQDTHDLAASAANDDNASAVRMGSSSPDASPTAAAAVAADPHQNRAQAASALSEYVSSQTGNFRDITGMDSKEYIHTLNEPHFPSLEVSERVRKSDTAPSSSSSSTSSGQHDAKATADSSSSGSSTPDDRFSRWQQLPRQQPDSGGKTRKDLADSEQLMSATAGAAASGQQAPAPATGGLTDQEIRLGPDGIDQARYQALEAAAGETATTADADSEPSSSGNSNKRRRRKGSKDANGSSSSNGQSDDADVASSSASAPLEAALSLDAPSPGAVALEDSSTSAAEAVKTTLSGTDASSNSTTADQLGALGGDVGGAAAAGDAGGDDETDVAGSSTGGRQPAAAIAGTAAAKSDSSSLEGAAAESAATAAVETGSSKRTDNTQSPDQQQQQTASSGDNSLNDAPATAYDVSESERMMSDSDGAAASGQQGPAPAAGGLTDQEIRLGPDGIDQARYQALEQAAGETEPIGGGGGASQGSSSSGSAPLEAALSLDAPSPGAVALEDSSTSAAEAVKATLSGTDASSNSTTADQLGALGGDVGGAAAAGDAGGGDDTDVAGSSTGGRQPAAAIAGTAAAKSDSSSLEGAAAESAATAAVETGSSNATSDRRPPKQQQQQQQKASSSDDDSLPDTAATADDLSESERMMSASGGSAAAGQQGPAPAAGGLTDQEIRLGPDGIDQARYQALEQAAGEVSAAAAGASSSGGSSRHVSLSSIDYSDLAGDSTVDLAEDLAASGLTAVRRSKDRSKPAASGEYQPDYQAFGGQVPEQYTADEAPVAASAASGAQPDPEADAYQPDYQAFGGQAPKQFVSDQAPRAASADSAAQPDTEASTYQPDYQAFGGQVPKQFAPDEAAAAAGSGAQPDTEAPFYQPDYQAFGGQVPKQFAPDEAAAAGESGAKSGIEASLYQPDYQAFGGQVPDQDRSSQATAADSSRPDSQASSDQASLHKDTSDSTAHTNLAADASAKAKESLHKAVQKVKSGGSSIRSVEDVGTTSAATGQGKSAAAAQVPSVRPSSPESSGNFGSFAAQRLATAAENLSKNGYTAARRSPEPGDTSSSSSSKASRDSSNKSSHDTAAQPAQPVSAAVQGLASLSGDTAQRLGQVSADVAQQLANASSAAAQQLASVSTLAAQQLGQGSAAAAEQLSSGLKVGSKEGVGVVRRTAGLVDDWVTQTAKAVWKLLQGLSRILRVSGMYLLTGATRTAAAVIHFLRTSTDKLILQPSTSAAHMLGDKLHHTAKHTRAQLPAAKEAVADAAATAATAAADTAAATAKATATGLSAAGSALGSTAAAAGSAVAAAAGAATQTVSSAAAGLVGSNASTNDSSSSSSTLAGKQLRIEWDASEGRTMRMALDTPAASTSSSSSSRQQLKARDTPLDSSDAEAATATAAPEVGVSNPGPLKKLQAAAAEAANRLGMAQAPAGDATASTSGTKRQTGQQTEGAALGGSSDSSSSRSIAGGNAADGPRSNGAPPASAAPKQPKGLLGKATGGLLKDLGRMARKPGSSSSTADRYAAISVLGSSWEEPDHSSYSIDEPYGAAAAATSGSGKSDSSADRHSIVPGAAAAASAGKGDSKNSSSSTTAAARGTTPAPGDTSSASSSSNGSTTGSPKVSTAAAESLQGQGALNDLAADKEVMQLLDQLQDLLQTHKQLKTKIRADTSTLNDLVRQLAALDAPADDSSDSTQSADRDASAADLTTSASASDAKDQQQQQLVTHITKLGSSMADSLQQLKDLEAAAAHIQDELADSADAAAGDAQDTTGIPQLYGAAIGYSKSSGSGSSSGESGAAAAPAAAGSGTSSKSDGPKSSASTAPKGGSRMPGTRYTGADTAGKVQLPVRVNSLNRHEQQLLLQLYGGGGGGSGGQGGSGGGKGRGGAGDHGHQPDHDGHRRRGFLNWVKAVLSHLGHMPVRDALRLAVQVWLGVVVLSGVAWYAYQLLYKVPVLEVRNMATTAVHAAETGADIAHGAVHTASTVAHAVGSAAGVETSLPSPDEIVHTGYNNSIRHQIKRLSKKLKPSKKHLGQGLKGLGSAGHSAASAVVSPFKIIVAGSKGGSGSPDKQAVMAAATRLGAGLLLLATAGAWGAEQSGKGGRKGRGSYSSKGMSRGMRSSKRRGGSQQSNAAVSLVRSVVGAALAVPAAVVGRGQHSSSKKSGRSASRLKDRAKSVVMNFDDGTLYGNELVLPGDQLTGSNNKKATAAAGRVGHRGLLSGRSALLSHPSAAGGSGAGDSHEYVQLYRTLMDRQSSWR